jgi:hypothetical protein
MNTLVIKLKKPSKELKQKPLKKAKSIAARSKLREQLSKNFLYYNFSKFAPFFIIRKSHFNPTI